MLWQEAAEAELAAATTALSQLQGSRNDGCVCSSVVSFQPQRCTQFTSILIPTRDPDMTLNGFHSLVTTLLLSLTL